MLDTFISKPEALSYKYEHEKQKYLHFRLRPHRGHQVTAHAVRCTKEEGGQLEKGKTYQLIIMINPDYKETC